MHRQHFLKLPCMWTRLVMDVCREGSWGMAEMPCPRLLQQASNKTGRGGSEFVVSPLVLAAQVLFRSRSVLPARPCQCVILLPQFAWCILQGRACHLTCVLPRTGQQLLLIMPCVAVFIPCFCDVLQTCRRSSKAILPQGVENPEA